MRQQTPCCGFWWTPKSETSRNSRPRAWCAFNLSPRTAPHLHGVVFVPVDPRAAVDGATTYFKSKGYLVDAATATACDAARAPPGCTVTLTRGHAEISIQQRQSAVEITKVNFD